MSEDALIATEDWGEIDAHCRQADIDTWVIWDIDSTLIFSNDIVFGCQNDLYKTQVAQVETFEMQDSQGSHDLKHTKELWYRIRRSLPYQLMDARIPATIRALQDRQVPTFALTFLLARTLEFDYLTWRKKQLSHVGIDFSSAFANNPTFTFPEIHPSQKEKAVPDVGCPTFSGGVFCTHHCDKGQCLERLFEILGQHPKRILFADDSYGNILLIRKVAERNNIRFLGIHYQGYLHFCEQAQRKDPTLLERWKTFKNTGVWPRIPIV